MVNPNRKHVSLKMLKALLFLMTIATFFVSSLLIHFFIENEHLHTIEKIITHIRVNSLTLRRYEKDYLLSQKLEYVKKLTLYYLKIKKNLFN